LEGGRRRAVSLVLLLFARQTIALDEQAFGAEQSDAFRATAFYRFGVGCLLDVGGQENGMTIQRDGRLEQHLPELVLQRPLLAEELPVLVKRLVRRRDHDQ